MNESKRPPTPAAPDSVWKSIQGTEETDRDTVLMPDQLCAMARSRERESIRSRRVLLALLIGLAAAFAYNVFAAGELWVRLSQGWMLAWTWLLVWRFRRGPRPMSAADNCADFLRGEFEGKRSGLLEIRRYLFLLIPPILVSWRAGGPAVRLRALGVDPSSRIYGFLSGPWPFLIIGLLLVLVWLAFGLAARRATHELEELRRRSQG